MNNALVGSGKSGLVHIDRERVAVARLVFSQKAHLWRNGEEFANDLWVVEGPNVRDMGFMFTTRMAVAKLSDGSVWVNSPVSVSFDMLKRITELGPVRYLLAATPRHVWRLRLGTRCFPTHSYGRRVPLRLR